MAHFGRKRRKKCGKSMCNFAAAAVGRKSFCPASWGKNHLFPHNFNRFCRQPHWKKGTKMVPPSQGRNLFQPSQLARAEIFFILPSQLVQITFSFLQPSQLGRILLCFNTNSTKLQAAPLRKMKQNVPS